MREIGAGVQETLPGEHSGWAYVAMAAGLAGGVGAWWMLASAAGVNLDAPGPSGFLAGVGLLLAVSLGLGFVLSKLLPRAGSVTMDPEGVSLTVPARRTSSIPIRRGVVSPARWCFAWGDLQMVGSHLVIRGRRLFSPRWFILNPEQVARVRERLNQSASSS